MASNSLNSGKLMPFLWLQAWENLGNSWNGSGGNTEWSNRGEDYGPNYRLGESSSGALEKVACEIHGGVLFLVKLLVKLKQKRCSMLNDEV